MAGLGLVARVRRLSWRLGRWARSVPGQPRLDVVPAGLPWLPREHRRAARARSAPCGQAWRLASRSHRRATRSPSRASSSSRSRCSSTSSGRRSSAMRAADERTIAPARVLLALGIAMIAAGPLVAAWRRIDAAGEPPSRSTNVEPITIRSLRPHLRSRLPQVISLGLTLAMLAFLTSVATPPRSTGPSAIRTDTRLARPDDIWTMAADGVAQTRLTTARAGVESFQEPIWRPDGAAIMVTAGRALAGREPGRRRHRVRRRGHRARWRPCGDHGHARLRRPGSPLAGRQPGRLQLPAADDRATPTPGASGAPAAASTRSRVGAGPQPGRDPGLGVQSGVTSAAPGFRWDIYVANADGTGERRLTRAGRSTSRPAGERTGGSCSTPTATATSTSTPCAPMAATCAS